MSFGDSPNDLEREHMRILAQTERRRFGIATIQDLLGVDVQECGEPLVVIPADVIHTQYRSPLDELKADHGNKIYVRAAVIERLRAAQSVLTETNSALQLYVVYGYRSDYLQHKYFLRELTRIRTEKPWLRLEEGMEEAHSWAAYPLVAGHPTGGCIDVTIRNRITDQELDMGARVYHLGSESKTGYRNLSPEALANRELLRSLLEQQGFHGFRGEFWHFSYGDREWAFHNNTHAIYAPLPEEAMKEACHEVQ